MEVIILDMDMGVACRSVDQRRVVTIVARVARSVSRLPPRHARPHPCRPAEPRILEFRPPTNMHCIQFPSLDSKTTTSPMAASGCLPTLRHPKTRSH